MLKKQYKFFNIKAQINNRQWKIRRNLVNDRQKYS